MGLREGLCHSRHLQEYQAVLSGGVAACSICYWDWVSLLFDLNRRVPAFDPAFVLLWRQGIGSTEALSSIS